jgi:membrane protease YdiL (CAAX protease family)
VHGWASVILGVLVVHFVYVGYVRLVERRPADELALTGAAAELGLGALIGAGVMVLSVAVLWLGGFYVVDGMGSLAATGPILMASIWAGYAEEVMFRAIIFRITEDGLGSWWAIAISSALFGLAHLGNPNATWISSAAITVEAGILLGALYMLTRRLWAVVGTHFAWNYTQGGVFGVAVSGNEVDGLLRSHPSGPELLSGGGFGIEASLLTVVICLVAAIAVLRLAIRRGHVVPPFWRRRRTSGEAADAAV